jgi:hypothetical protein
VEQSPQCAASLCTSQQSLSQSTEPEGHSQLPALQSAPSPQWSQRLPQCCGSLSTFQQLPSPHASVGFWVQAPTQAPFSHLRSASQAWPQSPQFSGSLCTSAQAMPHNFSPGAHWHTPARHTWPGKKQKARQAPHDTDAWVRSAHSAEQ